MPSQFFHFKHLLYLILSNLQSKKLELIAWKREKAQQSNCMQRIPSLYTHWYNSKTFSASWAIYYQPQCKKHLCRRYAVDFFFNPNGIARAIQRQKNYLLSFRNMIIRLFTILGSIFVFHWQQSSSASNVSSTQLLSPQLENENHFEIKPLTKSLKQTRFSYFSWMQSFLKSQSPSPLAQLKKKNQARVNGKYFTVTLWLLINCMYSYNIQLQKKFLRWAFKTATVLFPALSSGLVWKYIGMLLFFLNI